MRYPQAVEYLRERGVEIAEATLRRMVSRARVPYLKPAGGKYVYFDPAALDNWLERARVEPAARAAR
jgi:transposase